MSQIYSKQLNFPLSGSFTGSLLGSASYATTASYALNAGTGTSSPTYYIATGSVTASVSPTQNVFTVVSGSTSLLSVSSSRVVIIPGSLSFSANAGNIIALSNGSTIFSDSNNVLRIVNGVYNIFNASLESSYLSTITLGSLNFNSLLISSSGQFEYRSVLDSGGNPYFNITKGYAGANRNLLGANEIVLQVNNKYNGNPTNGGISRGIYVDLLTSGFSSYRAIETTTGNVTLNTTSGNTIIGSTTDSGFKLDVNGTTRSQGKLTVSTGGATIVGNTDITGSFNVDNINGVLTLSSGSNRTLTLNALSSSIIFNRQGSYTIELGYNGSKGIYAQDYTGGTAGDYINFTGKQGNFDTIQAGQGLSANQYAALNLVGRGYSGNNNIASINLKNSFSTNTTRMIIYDNAITGSPISILPTDGNLLVGTTTDLGYRLNVSGSGNFTNGLTVTGSTNIQLNGGVNTFSVNSSGSYNAFISVTTSSVTIGSTQTGGSPGSNTSHFYAPANGNLTVLGQVNKLTKAALATYSDTAYDETTANNNRLNVQGYGTTSATVNTILVDKNNRVLLKVLDDGSTTISGSLTVSGSFILPTTSSTSPTIGSAYWSGSFLYVYNGTRYMSSSFA